MATFLTEWRRRWMLTCKEVNGFLEAYVDGRLDTTTKAQFERHINGCETCRTYLQQYRATIDLVKEADPVNDHLPARSEALVDETLSFLRDHYEPPTNNASS
jgi:anti-sigma factor RsiW